MADPIDVERLAEVLEDHALQWDGAFTPDAKSIGAGLRSLASQLPALLSSRSDAERLDWMILNSAEITSEPTIDGMSYRVSFRPSLRLNGRTDFYLNPRDAIDEGMERAPSLMAAANRPSEEDDR